jgi:hypothetical protein
LQWVVEPKQLEARRNFRVESAWELLSHATDVILMDERKPSDIFGCPSQALNDVSGLR